MLLVYTSLKRLDPKYIFDMFKEYEHGLRSASRVQTKHCEAAFSCYAAHTHTHTRTHAHTHARTHKSTRTHTNTPKHTQTHTHARTRTHTHTHKHTSIHTLQPFCKCLQKERSHNLLPDWVLESQSKVICE